AWVLSVIRTGSGDDLCAALQLRTREFFSFSGRQQCGVTGGWIVEEPVKDIPVKQEDSGVTYSHYGRFSIWEVGQQKMTPRACFKGPPHAWPFQLKGKQPCSLSFQQSSSAQRLSVKGCSTAVPLCTCPDRRRERHNKFELNGNINSLHRRHILRTIPAPRAAVTLTLSPTSPHSPPSPAPAA
ncbi:unnamed protein product, partial [Pleuronectes platessa]